MFTFGIIVGILVLLLAGALTFLHFKGKSLPLEHTAFAIIQLNNSPEELWQVITDVARKPEWFKGLTKVERLPDRNGHTVWRETMGRNAFTVEDTVVEPPRKLVRVIADDQGPFSGSWEFLLIPVPSKDAGKPAVKVRLTERGKIHYTIPRAIMAMFGEDMYLKKYLKALATKFGQPAAFSND